MHQAEGFVVSGRGAKYDDSDRRKCLATAGERSSNRTTDMHMPWVIKTV